MEILRVSDPLGVPPPTSAKQVEAIVCFADVRGFTNYVKRLQDESKPRVTEGFLRAYFAIYPPALRRALDGVDPQVRKLLDAPAFKRMGDGMMLVWEMPEGGSSASGHLIRTRVQRGVVQVALELKVGFERLVTHKNAQERYTPLVKDLRLGAGLACGAVWRLEFKNKTRDYAGAIVNLASRLMDEARPSGIVLERNGFPSKLPGDPWVEAAVSVKGAEDRVVAVRMTNDVVSSPRRRGDETITSGVGQGESEFNRAALLDRAQKRLWLFGPNLRSWFDDKAAVERLLQLIRSGKEVRMVVSTPQVLRLFEGRGEKHLKQSVAVQPKVGGGLFFGEEDVLRAVEGEEQGAVQGALRQPIRHDAEGLRTVAGPASPRDTSRSGQRTSARNRDWSSSALSRSATSVRDSTSWSRSSGTNRMTARGSSCPPTGSAA